MAKDKEIKSNQRMILNLLSAKIIATSADLARMVGSVKTALFLSQLLYWSDRGADKEWIYKTIEEFEEETALTRDEQDGAIKKLKTLKILETKLEGVPPNPSPKRHFKIDQKKLIKLIEKYYSK